MTYIQIREQYQNHDFWKYVFVDPYVMVISPIFTKLFIRYGVIPNYVTILMILSGIIGAICFSFNSFAMKVAGVIFIHLWYILDCSDGEVARITNRFSKFGKEIDYTAHIIDHPLCNVAFMLSMISVGRYNNTYIMMTFMALIICDLVNRNLYSFEIIYDLKMPSGDGTKQDKLLKKIIMYCIAFFVDYPNFVLIFPIVFLIDFKLGTSISMIYMYAELIVLLLMTVRRTFKWVNLIKDI